MFFTVQNTAAMPAETQQPAIRVRVTLEMVLYLALAVLALTLRLVQLGSAPLNDAEAHDALAALRAVDPAAPGEPLVANSPLTFTLHAITFTFAPAGNLTARLPVALGGVLLVLAPALWRRYMRPLPPLIISLLLAISPVGFLASRTLSPVIWSMLLAVVGPWLALRFVETRRPVWAALATVDVALLLLLAEPAGWLTLAALGFGVMFAWLTEDDPDSDTARRLREVWRAWPWSSGALAAGMVVLVIGTGLFVLPSGLTAIGNSLWAGLKGFTQQTGDTPLAFPLWVALRYEPGIIFFGLIGVYRAVRVGGFFERALVGWFLAGLVWTLGYSGASAAHALWILLPLTVLVGLMITRWLTERPSSFFDVPDWGMPLHALITVALWLAVGMSIVLLGKLLIELPAGVDDLGALVRKLTHGLYSRDTLSVQTTTVQDMPVLVYVLGYIQLRSLITVLISMLVGVLFFLIGSLWGARVAWHGLALGTLAFLLLFGVGVGGRAAFTMWDDPRELWYPDPITNDVHELRGSLREMSYRETGTPFSLTLTAMVPQDGALAWALRDYVFTTFVDGVGPEISTAAVLMPLTTPVPVMGADYVGKDLMLRQSWDLGSLSWRDSLMWFYHNDSWVKPVDSELLMLWVRKDVYGVEQVITTEE